MSFTITDWIGIAAIVIPLALAGINWYSRLKTLESTVERHGKRLETIDTLFERLTRIETKLDIIMEERRDR